MPLLIPRVWGVLTCSDFVFVDIDSMSKWEDYRGQVFAKIIENSPYFDGVSWDRSWCISRRRTTYQRQTPSSISLHGYQLSINGFHHMILRIWGTISPCLVSRARQLRKAPAASIVVCTKRTVCLSIKLTVKTLCWRPVLLKMHIDACFMEMMPFDGR